MRKTITALFSVVLLTVLAGCGAGSPTRPPADPESVTFDERGGNGKGGGGGSGDNGGGATLRTFNVAFSGDLVTTANGLVTEVKNTDERMHLYDFPMDDIRFLRDHPNIEGGETCFADWQIGVGENIELLVARPKGGPEDGAGFNYWFDGVSQQGNPTLYRLVMNGTFTEGAETWIGDATAELVTWSINGNVEKSGGPPDRSACTGSGTAFVTMVIDDVT